MGKREEVISTVVSARSDHPDSWTVMLGLGDVRYLRVRELEQENESLQAERVEQIASTMAAIEQAKREGC